MADEHRKQQLEQRLQSILADLSMVCSELGVNLGGALSAPPAPAPTPRAPAPRAPALPETILEPGQILLALINSLEIGFVSTQVQELTRMVALSPSADPRPEIEGYVNVRGQAIPVIHLRHLLGGPSRPHHPDQFLVFLRGHNDIRIAVVIDEVLDIHHVTEQQIQNRETLELRKGFIQGVIQIECRLIPVIDPYRLVKHAL